MAFFDHPPTSCRQFLYWGLFTCADTVDSGYKGMLNRGNSGYRGQFAADQNFYLVKAGQIEEKGAF